MYIMQKGKARPVRDDFSFIPIQERMQTKKIILIQENAAIVLLIIDLFIFVSWYQLIQKACYYKRGDVVW